MQRQPAPPVRTAPTSSAGRRLRLYVLAWRTFGVSIAQALTLTACAAGPEPGPVRGAQSVAQSSSATQTLAALRAAVGDAPCIRDAQCHSVGIGERPCGGPEAYLAWSEQNTDAVHIEALAARHAAVRKAENARNGVASDCRFRPDPGAVCRPRTADGLPGCQLGTGRAGAV